METTIGILYLQDDKYEVRGKALKGQPDALQSTSMNHEWNGNTLLFEKGNSRTNKNIFLGICNENDIDETSRLAHVYCQIHNGKHFPPRPVWFLSIETVYSERPQPFSITKEFSSFFSQQSKLYCLWLLLSSMLAFFKGYIKTLNWIAQPLIKLCLWMNKVLPFENAKLKY